jgi:alpha-tubulin suppressor-like RCC1 family protein
MCLRVLAWQARGLLLKAFVGWLIFLGVENDIFSQTMAGGRAHSLFIDNGGQLWAWGANNAGQLGDVTKDQNQRLKPLRIGAETDWEKVYADGDTSYAIKKEGSLWAWGEGSLGQLGDGTITDRTSPVRIGGTSLWDQLSTRDGAVLGIRRDGTLWAWGKNVNGTLGLGLSLIHI